MKKKTIKFYIAVGSLPGSNLLFHSIYKSKKEAEIELKKFGWKIVKVEKKIIW